MIKHKIGNKNIEIFPNFKDVHITQGKDDRVTLTFDEMTELCDYWIKEYANR
jgi:hypothetical protein